MINMYIEDINNTNAENIEKMTYGSTPYGSSSFGGTAALVTCPVETKYEGDTITLKATPKDGTGPYYVVFRKNGIDIDPSRLGGSNPISPAPEDIEITRVYTLDNEDIRTAFTGTIDFSVFIQDSCPVPLGPKTCSDVCTITIGCMAPVCNFTVT